MKFIKFHEICDGLTPTLETFMGNTAWLIKPGNVKFREIP